MKSLHKKYHVQKGFTLIELVVVVAILGLLMTVVVPTFLGALNKSHGNKSEQILQEALSVSDGYFQFKGSYLNFDTGTPPTWPTQHAGDIKWSSDPSWTGDVQEKTVHIEVSGSNDILGLAVRSTNGKYYCIKVVADMVTYGTDPSSWSVCAGNATAKNWAST